MGPGRAGPHRVRFSFDGTSLEASRGMTVGGALLANGIVSWHRTRLDGRPRGIFCGTGVCFDCLVDVGDRHAVRACLVLVTRGGAGYCQGRVCGPALQYAVSAAGRPGA